MHWEKEGSKEAEVDCKCTQWQQESQFTVRPPHSSPPLNPSSSNPNTWREEGEQQFPCERLLTCSRHSTCYSNTFTGKTGGYVKQPHIRKDVLTLAGSADGMNGEDLLFQLLFFCRFTASTLCATISSGIVKTRSRLPRQHNVRRVYSQRVYWKCEESRGGGKFQSVITTI